MYDSPKHESKFLQSSPWMLLWIIEDRFTVYLTTLKLQKILNETHQDSLPALVDGLCLKWLFTPFHVDILALFGMRQ